MDQHFSTTARQDASDPETEEPLPFRAFTRRRVVAALVLLLAVVMMLVLPPLFNVGRYKHQIASSLGASLGRPVHIDNVSLTLLPLPGFTLEHFVVGEDAAFGAEPVLRAEQVHATIRFASLWRRRLEFSRVALTDPSINLVHLPDGRWNLESILLQASHIPAAPTAQKSSGEKPRFPYIEATGARINLKQGAEKTPYSLTEADVALWLPEPGKWHFRIKAHPTRTDTAVLDTGLIQVDGTLGQAATLAEVPLHLLGDWTAAPLGALSLIVLGKDAGLRGVMDLHGSVDGTPGDTRLHTQLVLEKVRRADFVPHRSLSADIQCTAHALHFFHSIESASCTWPGETEGYGLHAVWRLPDTTQPSSAEGRVSLRDVPLAGLLDLLRVASNRVSPDLTASGLLSADFTFPPVSSSPTPLAQVRGANLALPDRSPFVQADVDGTARVDPSTGQTLTLTPIPLDLGGKAPASLLVQISRAGVRMQLTGEGKPERVRALAEALPQFGDGLGPFLPAPVPADPAAAPPLMAFNLTGEHRWLNGQTWTETGSNAAPARKAAPAHRRHRR